jgi:hypothetical protein
MIKTEYKYSDVTEKIIGCAIKYIHGLARDFLKSFIKEAID